MFDLKWELWRNWVIVQGAILFVSWLVIKFGDLGEEDKKDGEDTDA
jgi:hypothetical protein